MTTDWASSHGGELKWEGSCCGKPLTRNALPPTFLLTPLKTSLLGCESCWCGWGTFVSLKHPYINQLQVKRLGSILCAVKMDKMMYFGLNARITLNHKCALKLPQVMILDFKQMFWFDLCSPSPPIFSPNDCSEIPFSIHNTAMNSWSILAWSGDEWLWNTALQSFFWGRSMGSKLCPPSFPRLLPSEPASAHPGTVLLSDTSCWSAPFILAPCGLAAGKGCF